MSVRVTALEGASVATLRRRERLELARLLRSVSRLPRVQGCGRRRIDKHAPVVYGRTAGGAATISNLQRCGSVHACAFCQAKIRNAYAEDIRKVAGEHLEAGGQIGFLTLTLPHDQGDELARLWDACAKSWQRVWSGEAAMATRLDYRVMGTIRALEVTHGRNGWHPHLHVLVLFGTELEDRELAEFTDWVFERWGDAVEGHGYRRPSLEHGVYMERVGSLDSVTRLGAYLTELENGALPHLELARQDLKLGAGSSRTPMEILSSLGRTGDVRDLSLWWEWELASKGRRCLTWSPGLKAHHHIEERTDLELAQAETASVASVAVPLETHRALLELEGGLALVLETIELEGAFAAMCLLRSWGLLAWLPEDWPDS